MTAANTLAVVVALATVAGLLLATITLQIVNDRPDMFLPATAREPVIVWADPVVLIGRPPVPPTSRPMWSAA